MTAFCVIQQSSKPCKPVMHPHLLIIVVGAVTQVRDFAFSPDDGRIVELVIDALGIPAIPERLLGRLGVRTQLVQNISWSSITLQPGAEAYVNRISRGPFDSFGDLLKVGQA